MRLSWDGVSAGRRCGYPEVAPLDSARGYCDNKQRPFESRFLEAMGPQYGDALRTTRQVSVAKGSANTDGRCFLILLVQ